MTETGTAFSARHDRRSGANSDDRDWLLTAGGASLVMLALSKRSTIGLGALVGGGYLLYRALPPGAASRLIPKSLPAGVPDGLRQIGRRLRSAGGSVRAGRDWYPREDADSVDEASMDSFPASDPATKF